MAAAAATKSTQVSTRVLTTNKHLIRWVEKMADLCQPEAIHWVDGSEAENDTCASNWSRRERLSG